MQRVSQAVRNFTLADATDDSPYGSNWDLLWLGHCADGSPGSAPSLAFDDPSAVPHESFKGWSTGIVKEIEEGQRAVFASIYPVCTFAYAVTAKSASTILDFVGEGQDFAFDLKMNRGCGKHRYRCITVSPELMRHFKPDEQYGTSSEIAQQNGEGTESRLSTQSAADVRGTTENIRNSARCKAIFDEECFVA